MIWIILAILLAVCSLWMCIRPYIPPTLPAYAALWVLRSSGEIVVPDSVMMSWGMAVIILLLIDYIQPRAISKATNGTVYFTVGAVTGAVVGLTAMSQTAIVAGAAVGVVLGGLAYSRTDSGRMLAFPSVRFFQYLCAKGFPAIVALSIIGVGALLWIIRHYPAFALENMTTLR